MKRIILIVLALVVIAGFYFYAFVWNKDHPEYQELEADFSIQAEQLYNDFVSDNEASSLKYNGKMIELSGDVTSIEKIEELTIAVFVFNEGMFGDEGIRCTFLNNKENVISTMADLEGKKIKGFCTGYNDTDVILEKCSLTN